METMQFNTLIYAIVREPNSENLRLIKKYISLDKEPTLEEMSDYFDYAISLGDSYCSCLPSVNPDSLKHNYMSRQWRQKALAFEHTLQVIQSEYDVVAYSHRIGGVERF